MSVTTRTVLPTGTWAVDPAHSNVEFSVKHLGSEDFFHAEVHPELSFESTEIRPLGEDAFLIHGQLTMRGVTLPIALEAEVQGTEIDPWGNERVALEARGQLSRGEWGLVWNQALGSGNMLVSDKVKLSLDIS